MDVRPANERDLDAIDRIYDHYVLHTHVTFDVEPVGAQGRRRWFAEHGGGRHRVLVAENDAGVVGYAKSGPHRPRPAYATTVETSVYVAPDAVGNGIGSALYRELFRALEGEDVHRAVAGIAQPNEASVALHRRFGFELVGRFTETGRKFGRYWDVDWYERPM